MDSYSIDRNIDGWPICKNGEPMSDKEILHELTSLREQVEELSKYPEEAVRAVFEYLFPAPVVEKFMEINGDKLAAIFKEKQGLGK